MEIYITWETEKKLRDYLPYSVLSKGFFKNTAVNIFEVSEEDYEILVELVELANEPNQQELKGKTTLINQGCCSSSMARELAYQKQDSGSSISFICEDEKRTPR